jgi:hypothetical protein
MADIGTVSAHDVAKFIHVQDEYIPMHFGLVPALAKS